MQYMKWIFLSIAGVCTLYAAKAKENTPKAQEFTLSGKVGHYSAPAKAYLLYLLAGAETVDRDSVTMKDGLFVFKGSIPYPVNTWLIISPDGKGMGEGKSSKLYLQPGTVTVTSPDSLANARITGGQLNADYDQIKQSLKPLQAERLAARLAYPTADSARKKALAREDDSLEAPKSGIRGCFGARFYAAGHGRSTGVAA